MKILKSKKFQMTLGGIIVVIITNYIPEIDKAEVTKIVGLIVAYVFSQGLADFGKERG